MVLTEVNKEKQGYVLQLVAQRMMGDNLRTDSETMRCLTLSSLRGIPDPKVRFERDRVTSRNGANSQSLERVVSSVGQAIDDMMDTAISSYTKNRIELVQGHCAYPIVYPVF
jgi:hypothetical protein